MHGSRLPKRLRISQVQLIQALFKSTFIGKSSSVCVRVSYTGLSIGRVLVTVPKRVGSAVVRNRVKRRLRAAWCKLKRTVGYDYALIGNFKTSVIGFSQLLQELANAVDIALRQAQASLLSAGDV